MEKIHFDRVETVVSSSKIGDFIREHRQWFNEREGFQIHLSNVEFHLTYTFDFKILTFESESHLFEGVDDIIDFGDWLYMKGRGFYKKLRTRERRNITPGMRIQEKKIPLFIRKYREELEQIKYFFSSTCPLERAGLNISMSEEGRLSSSPNIFIGMNTVRKRYVFWEISPMFRVKDC